jgi:phosphate transport system permease protein
MASLRRTRRTVANAAFTGFCWFAAAVALGALTAILWTLLIKGFGGLNLKIFTMDTPAAGSPGGLRNAIFGSIVMSSMAMVMSILVGVMAGTYLAEYGRNSLYANVIRFLNDILLSAPSILIGLFAWTLLVAPFHGYSALAGSVALALIAVPIITRTTEDVLKLQPTALRESGVALGVPHWTTIRKILWKAAGSGILTGGLLAFARISGETAPLLFTALGEQFFSWDLTKEMSALPLVMYQFANSASDDLVQLAWVAALIVTFAVLATNVIARFLTREPRRS